MSAGTGLSAQGKGARLDIFRLWFIFLIRKEEWFENDSSYSGFMGNAGATGRQECAQNTFQLKQNGVSTPYIVYEKAAFIAEGCVVRGAYPRE
jgi:hypothetical protein